MKINNWKQSVKAAGAICGQSKLIYYIQVIYNYLHQCKEELCFFSGQKTTKNNLILKERIFEL